MFLRSTASCLSFFVFSSLTLLSPLSYGDEGMWTLDNLPKNEIQNKYDVKIDKAWTDKIMLSSARLANGCSGSFISKTGLVMTNHHCVRDCIYRLSTPKEDFLKKGFHAKKRSEERQCPAFEVNRLVKIEDVTGAVKKELKGLSGEAYSKAKKSISARLEKSCGEDLEKYRCDLVDLYHGGEFHLYRYQRFQDVRMVFAPEQAIAHFGGDPDNFNFPRYAFDVSFLRVYEEGKPLDNLHYFKWSKTPSYKGEPSFITGHPGSTQRLLTLAQLEYLRDYQLPDIIAYLAEMRGYLYQFQKQSAEARRIAASKIGRVDNGLKALKGRAQSLRDKVFFSQIEKKEKTFRYQLTRNVWHKNKYGDPWKEIESAVEKAKERSSEINIVAFGGFESELFAMARHLVRLPEELKKANSQRLSEYTDSRLPQLKQMLFTETPIYNDIERLMIEFYLIKMRESLGPDHAFVKKVMGRMSTSVLAKKWIEGSYLKKASERKRLFEQGSEAIKSSKDPLIQLARLIDKDSRDLRLYFENNIESKLNKYSEVIAQAQFDIFGKNTYPDATFSLRLSYGKVQGYKESGQEIYPMTVTSGLYERATGSDPFELPQSWIRAEKKLNHKTHFNFVSTNDIIGGNSGSPVIDKNAEVMGIVFDGNIHSLGGAYAYDPNLNRAVSLDANIITEALDKVYGAKELLKEFLDKTQTGFRTF